MIPFEVSFRRAETVDEAVLSWVEASHAGLTALYYGGGTEIVTLARDTKRQADVLIDYKRIPDTQICGTNGGAEETWRVGSAVRLNTVIDTPGTGLIAHCFSGVADRTVRNSITVGGNICGMLAYREGVLPFLLLDGAVTYAYPENGAVKIDTQPVNDLFRKKLRLPKGGLALSFGIDAAVMERLGLGGTDPSDNTPGRVIPGGEVGTPHEAPAAIAYGPVTAGGTGPGGAWFYRRHTKEPRVDYPLVTVALALISGSARLAVAGAWGYPVRADKVEDALNATGLERIAAMGESERRSAIERAVDGQKLPFKKDMRGSRRYRRELTIQAIGDGVLALTGDRGGAE